MQKLNQRGWGLGIMLVFICVFIVAIVIISVQASRLGISGSHNFATPIPTKIPNVSSTPKPEDTPSKLPTSQKSMIELENVAAKSAELYRSKYYDSLQKGDNVTVTVKKLLQEGMLDLLVYANDQSCSGYVVIKVDGNKSYLKCGTIKTDGYLTEFDS